MSYVQGILFSLRCQSENTNNCDFVLFHNVSPIKMYLIVYTAMLQFIERTDEKAETSSEENKRIKSRKERKNQRNSRKLTRYILFKLYN